MVDLGRGPARLAAGPIARLPSLASAWRPAFRRYGWALAASVGTLSVSVATNAVASRVLGPTGFGHFAVGVTVLTLLGTAMGLGMPVTIVRFVSQLPGAGAARQQSRLAAWSLVAAGGIVFGFAFLALRAGVPRLLTGWVPDGTAIALVLAALGTAFTQMAAAETQIALDFRKYFATLV